jgi:hypothetical protein
MKIKITLIALAFACLPAIAQIDVRAYGGVNVVQLSTDQGESLIDEVTHNRSISGRPGYQFGAAVLFGERFYVQPGFQWTTVSTEVVNENTATGAELTDETTVSMISVPLRVGFRLIDPEVENMFNVRVWGGFDGHHVTSVDHSVNDPNTGAIDEGDYSNLIVNADFGLGIDILFFFIESGYQLGISPVYTGGDQAKANSFYANLGVRFSFGY